MFKDLGIKGRVLLLTLLPTSLLAMVLGGYFTWVQLSDMRAQLIERGQLIAEQLAPLAATTACPAPPSLTTSAYSAGSNWNCRTTGLCCADIAACSPASC